MSQEFVGLWQRFRVANQQRVAELARAAEQTVIDDDMRASAVQAAHQLAGSLGGYGFADGTRLAREVDRILRSGESVAQLRPLVAALTEIIARESPPIDAAESALSPETGPSLLIVEDDEEFATRIAVEAAARGFRTSIATDTAAGRRAIAGRPPDIVLLDLSFPPRNEDGLTLLAQLAKELPDLPVMVLTGTGGFAERVDVTGSGGRGFLEKTLPMWQVLDAVAELLERQRATRARVLVVDDDPQVLAQVSAVLEPAGLAVSTANDPISFWQILDQLGPDLLVLDVDMPHVNGIELCQVVRNDPRWASLPILFLTARTEPDLVHSMFAAGADDYVAKPIVGPELATRITNRLERSRLLRLMAETDYLTGLANRRRSTSDLERLLRHAARGGSPFTLAIIDVDRFKHINDQYGHSVGDVVLRYIAERLRRTFRAEDVIARWGGDEFVLGLNSMHRVNALQRLTHLLEVLATGEIVTPSGTSFHVTVSVGTAQFPQDGADLQALYRAADQALYLAKKSGRSRVVAASTVD